MADGVGPGGLVTLSDGRPGGFTLLSLATPNRSGFLPLDRVRDFRIARWETRCRPYHHMNRQHDRERHRDGENGVSEDQHGRLQATVMPSRGNCATDRSLSDNRRRRSLFARSPIGHVTCRNGGRGAAGSPTMNFINQWKAENQKTKNSKQNPHHHVVPLRLECTPPCLCRKNPARLRGDGALPNVSWRMGQGRIATRYA